MEKTTLYYHANSSANSKTVEKSGISISLKSSILATATLGSMIAFNVYAAGQCDLSSPWGYGATNGPACWGEMDFNLCAEGREQSPINIRTNDDDDDDDDDGGNDDDDGLPPLDFSGYGTDVALECSGPVNCGEEEAVQHNVETIKAHLPKPLSNNTLQIGNAQYDLKEFHFHQRSEHRIDGMSYPMESHIVHVASDGSGSLAVVGIFIKEGAKHDELAKIWDDLPREKGDVVEVGSFNLKKLLPSNLASYRYDGSLTTNGIRLRNNPIRLRIHRKSADPG